MIHIRVDDELENSKRKFACGLGPELPTGDTYFYVSEALADVKADCPGCNPIPRKVGTPSTSQGERSEGEKPPDSRSFAEALSHWGAI